MQDEIERRIKDAIADAEVAVAGDGNRYEIEVTSAAFEGLSRVKKQQLVYAAIADLISDGSVHAVTIRTIVPGEG